MILRIVTNIPQHPRKKGWLERFIPVFEKHELRFIILFSGFFLATVVLLAGLGLVPSEFQDDTQAGILDQIKDTALRPLVGDPVNVDLTDGNPTASSSQNIKYEYPLRIVIASVGVDGIVKNPSSADINVLDNELTLGAVRYPGSGVPGLGNMFIFGHSTGYKIVQNKAYKIFNTIKNAKEGDEIQVLGDRNVYIYKVTSVKEVNKDETLVKFDTKGPATLTLSTCDSFGAKTDRFVVQATFDRVIPLR
ncbi:MAG: sortase [bacterium]